MIRTFAVFVSAYIISILIGWIVPFFTMGYLFIENYTWRDVALGIDQITDIIKPSFLFSVPFGVIGFCLYAALKKRIPAHKKAIIYPLLVSLFIIIGFGLGIILDFMPFFMGIILGGYGLCYGVIFSMFLLFFEKRMRHHV